MFVKHIELNSTSKQFNVILQFATDIIFIECFKNRNMDLWVMGKIIHDVYSLHIINC